MALDSRHPLYTAMNQAWSEMSDTYAGEPTIKAKGQAYLPATSGQVADGVNENPRTKGGMSYAAYKNRAVFHGFVENAVVSGVGVMHHKPADIQLPDKLEPLRGRATTRNESLEQLLRRINEAQLVAGRIGLLLDLPEIVEGKPLPYIATYSAQNIINWDDDSSDGQLVLNSLNFVALDETSVERDDNFEWQEKEKYRVLLLGSTDTNEVTGVYRTGVFQEGQDFSEEKMTVPNVRGRTLDQIPFVFVNSSDLLSTPDTPPLHPLARISLAIYRGEADYRQSLFMQGQDTLVTVGRASEDGDELRVGSNAVINVPLNGDAKYIGVSSDGLTEQRSALENDKNIARQYGGQLTDSVSRERESGDALKTRVSAQTATLNDIALTSAAGLEKILRIAAEWVGADPDEVHITPNLDFSDEQLSSRALVEYMSAKALGAPISLQSIHDLMKRKGLTKLEFDAEKEIIENEEPLVDELGTEVGGDRVSVVDNQVDGDI